MTSEKVMCLNPFNVINITDGNITENYTINKGTELYLINIDGIEPNKFVHLKVNTIIEGMDDNNDWVILYNAEDFDTLKGHFVTSHKLTLLSSRSSLDLTENLDQRENQKENI